MRSLRGETVCFTGTVYDGDHTLLSRHGLIEEVRDRGGQAHRHLTSDVTLLVHGTVEAAQVTDESRRYTRKLLWVEQSRAAGRHVHVVDADGFIRLMNGKSAACRELDKDKRGNVRLSPERPFQVRSAPSSDASSGWRIEACLDGLERATRAHETLRGRLDAHLKAAGVRPHERTRDPLYDLGWRMRRSLVIAEVKSLTSTYEEHQVRLAFGQVLDYKFQLRDTESSVLPVIVLERKPRRAQHWRAMGKRHGVVVTWAPRFPGIPR